MDELQVSITCLLLLMTLDPSCQGPIRCPTCPEGYFVMQNCTASPVKVVGVRCKRCSDCSAVRQDTLVKCSTFSDSVCGNRTTAPPAAPPAAPSAVSAPETWIVVTVILVSAFLIILLSLFLRLLFCQNQQVWDLL